MYYCCKHMPQDFKEKYAHLIQNSRILIKSTQAIYGMHDAGSISGANLSKCLRDNGYQEIMTSNMWKSTEKGEEVLLFNINVDDFGIIYDPKSKDLQRLRATLTKVGYEYTMQDLDSDLIEFCGLHVHHNRITHVVTLTMPGYIQSMLQQFNMSDRSPAKHPYTHTNHSYFNNKPQAPSAPDNSKRCNAEQVHELQQKLGKCRWVIDGVFPALTLALGRLACRMGTPTESLLKDTNHMMLYMAGHKNPAIQFKPCNMQLGIFSDASFSSETNSRSRSGAVIFAGGLNENNEPMSAPLAIITEVTNTVADSAAEAEYMAVYTALKTAIYIRDLLIDIGYSQDKVIHRCDNQCAVGLANRTNNNRKVKHIQRRFHWVQDQVDQEWVKVIWEKGTSNIADYFTKQVDKESHKKMMRIFGLQCDKHGNLTDEVYVNMLAGIGKPTLQKRVCWDITP